MPDGLGAPSRLFSSASLGVGAKVECLFNTQLENVLRFLP